MTDNEIEMAWHSVYGSRNDMRSIIAFGRVIEGAATNARIAHLSAVVAEYEAWIRCHASGGDFDTFLAEQKAERGEE